MNEVGAKWRTGRIIQPEDNWSTWIRTCPSVILSKINPTWTGTSSNPDLLCNRPETFCLSHSLQSIASNKYIRQRSHTTKLHLHNNGTGNPWNLVRQIYIKKTVTNVILVLDPLKTLLGRCRQKLEDYIGVDRNCLAERRYQQKPHVNVVINFHVP